MSAISIHNLSVVYGRGSNRKTAVKDLSFEVEEGEFFGLLGPNGAGKTSVIGSLTGLLPVRRGEANIFGFPAGSLNAKRCIGVVPQELVHHGFFSVNEILNLFSGYYAVRNNQKRVNFLLERLQLEECKYKKVSQLSGGMKRRLLIAKALVHSPKLLLLDEPSAGVDIELRTILWDFMSELNHNGTTIVLTTHYLEEAQRLCPRIAIMNDARLLALDDTGDLISSSAERVIYLSLKKEKLPTAMPQSKSSRVLAIEGELPYLKVKVDGQVSLSEILEALDLSLDQIFDIRMEEGALERAFMKVVKDQRNVAS